MSDLEREYSPSSRVGGSSAPFIAAYERRSEEAAAALLGDGRGVDVLPGGTRLVRAATGSPLLVFVHGGYWQALSAAASLYLAPGALAQGWSYAAVEYTVAPEGTLPTMVAEVRAALEQLATIGGHGPVTLAGHSAGAHLVAMSALVQASPLAIDHVALLSGVYDLRPIVHTTVNDPLGMDDAAAAANSPALLPVSPGDRAPHVTVAVGDNETDAFHAQNHVYAARLRSAGLSVAELVVQGRHHFDIVDDLVDPASAVAQAMITPPRP